MTTGAGSSARSGPAVVVGVDGSPGAERALYWAVAAAARRGLPLVTVCAWRTPLVYAGPASAMTVPQLRRVAEHHAHDVATAAAEQAVAAGVEATATAVEGHPAQVLLAAAAGADVLVVGDRGAGAVGRFLLGSVSTAVVHHADLPVTVVRGEQRPARGCVVVGVDGSEAARRALSRAAVEASARDCRLLVLGAWHVVDADLLGAFAGRRIPPLEDLHAAAGRRVDEAVAAVLGAAPQVETRVVHDTPVDALLSAADDADLLVLGSRGLGAFDRMLLGSVSTACLHHSPCPVEIVP